MYVIKYQAVEFYLTYFPLITTKWSWNKCLASLRLVQREFLVRSGRICIIKLLTLVTTVKYQFMRETTFSTWSALAQKETHWESLFVL